MATTLWTRIENESESFVTELSDLNGAPAGQQRRCLCDAPVLLVNPLRDPDGDIMHWETLCRCGRRLMVLND